MRQRQIPYRASIWSWASVDGPITSGFAQPELADVPLAEIRDIDLMDSPQEIAAQTSARMRIRGRVIPIQKVGDPEASNDNKSYGFRLRNFNVKDMEERTGLLWLDELISDSAGLFALPILEDSDWSFSDHPLIRGLVLVQKGVFYERVASFKISGAKEDVSFKKYAYDIAEEYDIVIQ